MAALHPIARPTDSSSLADLRREIDSIDDTVQDLLIRRAEIAVAVVQAKRRESGPRAPVFRPAREAEILRRLIARNRAPLAPELVARLWRAIIVSSNRLQGPLSVAVAAPLVDLARAHFGDAAMAPLRSAAAVLAAVATGRAPLGIVALPSARTGGDWWQAPALSAAGGVRILGRLPFLAGGRSRPATAALILGRQDFEPTADDRLYVRLKTATRAAALSGLRPAVHVASVRRGGSWLHLLEIAQPLAALRSRLGGDLEFLGGYARPMVLTARKAKAKR